MAFTEKIRVLFEINDKAAVGSFGNIRKSINEAEGARGKMHAGLSSTSSFLKANVAEAAMAAGTALVAFGVKSVQVYQDLALEVGKFGDATGMAYEDASRLVDIAGDLGVEVGTIQSAVQRMNLAIEGGKLGEFEDQIVLASDSSVDAYESFLNLATSIGAIENPTERARKAQQTFGKSYGEIAELMEMDAESLREKLAEVPQTNIIDEKQVKQAREFRQSIEDLKGKLEELQLSIGAELVPALTEMADGLVVLDDAITSLPFVEGTGDVVKYGKALVDMGNPLGVIRKTFDFFKDDVEEADEALGKFTGTGQTGADVLAMYEAAAKRANIELGTFTGTAETAEDVFQKYEKAAKDSGYQTRDLEQAFKDADEALDRLKGNVDERSAWRNMYDSLADLMTLVDSGEASWDDLSEASDDLALSLADVIESMGEIPPEVKTQLYTELDQGNLDAVRLYLEGLQRGIDLPIRPKVVGQGASLISLQGGAIPRFDSGGVMPGPKGEHNLALVAGGETILPTHKPGAVSPAMGGVTINATIQAQATPRDTYDSLIRAIRLNGGADLRRALGL